MSKIIIVENDVKLRNELEKLLTSYGYECNKIEDFKNAVEDILKANGDLILLDISLPYYDGYHICREIRKKSLVPIIMVTSKNNDMDEIMSINLGADDYITKPYNTAVLLAHISAVLKRVNIENNSQIIRYNEIILNISKSTVTFKDKSIELTKNEVKILIILMKSKGNIVAREEIMNEIWQTDEFVDDNTLTVNINRLRSKLEDIDIYNFIETRRGQGYKI